MAWIERTGDKSWRVRYRRDDRTVGTVPAVFATEKAAADHAHDLESDRRRGTWIDPAAGQTTVNEYVPDWLDALDVDPRTEANYRSKLRTHILPRWGDVALADITGLKAHAWAKKLRAGGLAPITVDGIMKLFTMLLADAVDEELIATNPIKPKRRGRRSRPTRSAEKIWAEPADIILTADQIAAHYGAGGAALLITGAWTGARWGELAGLHRSNLHHHDDDTGSLVIDPDIGALHEGDTGQLWLGPPKTAESARTISLPPFLTRLLRAHLATHPQPHVFVSPDNQLLRRSNFSRRALRPAADGNLHVQNPRRQLQPIAPGLTFHGLRHSHKTWMIADNIPEIAQSLRLGHVLKDKVQQTYSHVAAEVETRLLDALQHRWDKAISNLPATTLDTSWRDTAEPIERSCATAAGPARHVAE